MALKLPLEELQRIHQMLNTIPFLKSLVQDEIKEMAFQLARRFFAKGEVIIRQGEPGTLFYLIYKGRVRVVKEKLFSKTLLANLGPGEFFGEMALIDDFPRTATVIGEEPGEMYTLSHDAFESVLLANPQVKELIMNTAHDRKAKNKAMEA